MKILLVGALGTVGRAVAAELGTRHELVTAGRQGGDLRLDLADYLSEESRSLVGQREADARFAELDNLKLALDRLDARIERLAQLHKPQT